MTNVNRVKRFIHDWILPDIALFIFCVLLLLFVWGVAFLQVDRDRESALCRFSPIMTAVFPPPIALET